MVSNSSSAALAPDAAGLSAVVTGGSRGLGLLLGRELAARGATVTLLARDGDELTAAADTLRETGGGSVRTAVCDLRDRAATRKAVDEAAEAAGGLDVVIANAGIIQVAPASALGPAGFDEAMRSIFETTVNTAFAALPHLRASRAGGRLALIGSVGGLMGTPHLLPYSCAKSAVGALAEGLRAEESAHGVSVTAVHPGLMRTGSHLHARFGGDAPREFAWFSAVAGVPVVSMDAERAASRIVSGVLRRRARLLLTPATRVVSVAHGLAPATTNRLVSLFARALPADVPDGDGSTREGADLADAQPPGLGAAARRMLGALNERAASRFNERAARHPGA
ncbi:SDR family NAD(P)-dependent oxidoreductase [Streptomyces sp. NPDC059740]|uniref:SDR family NAD(P)-dependent oxidoreductase n=1 Tax=Streptomyces sp. NPDC059740 TaxID=3346926 RepID=UPI00365EB6A3